jgi:hypothetical protein
MNQLQVFFYISVIPLTDTGCFDSSSFSCSSSSSRILTVTQMEQNNCRKIGSFLGAEANKSKDEHDDEDDSLISGSGLNALQRRRTVSVCTALRWAKRGRFAYFALKLALMGPRPRPARCKDLKVALGAAPIGIGRSGLARGPIRLV